MRWKQFNWRERRRRRPLDSGRAGFTLLEVVVAITLMAALVAILCSGLRLAAGAWRRGTEQLDSLGRNIAAVQAMTFQAGSAVPLAFTWTENNRQLKAVSFQGTPRQMRFLTRYSWTGDRSHGLWLATFRVTDAPDGRQQLVISESGVSQEGQMLAALLAQEAPEGPRESVGLPADRIEFLYLQSSSTTTRPKWESEWDATRQDRLPRGIEVRWWRGDRAETSTFVIPPVEEAK